MYDQPRPGVPGGGRTHLQQVSIRASVQTVRLRLRFLQPQQMGCIGFSVKAHSHRAKAKIFFDV